MLTEIRIIREILLKYLLCCSAPLDDLSPEERDARTVFCMQLSQRVRARDLEEFFSSVGKVEDSSREFCLYFKIDPTHNNNIRLVVVKCTC